MMRVWSRPRLIGTLLHSWFPITSPDFVTQERGRPGSRGRFLPHPAASTHPRFINTGTRQLSEGRLATQQVTRGYGENETWSLRGGVKGTNGDSIPPPPPLPALAFPSRHCHDIPDHQIRDIWYSSQLIQPQLLTASYRRQDQVVGGKRCVLGGRRRRGGGG